MFGGFYTVKFQLGQAVGHSVMHAGAGKMLGGNSAFAHIGTYEDLGGEIAIEITTVRHNPDPNYPAMAGTDDATLLARGKLDGARYRFEGRLNEVPDALFQSVMTPVEEQSIPIAGGVGEGGIVNGLYSIHLRMLDGVEGGLTGVMLLNDGRILGGDAPLRTAAGRDRSSTRNTRPPKAITPCSAAMRSASAFPAAARRRARCWKQLRSPASAAFD